jgi:hypothetical protein
MGHLIVSGASLRPPAAGFPCKPVRRRTISAVGWQPPQSRNQLRCQLDAAGIENEALLEDVAATAVNIKIFTGGPGVDDLAPAILQFFIATAAALLAEGIPLGIIVGLLGHVGEY